MIRQAEFNDAESKNFSDKLASDLEKWLLEVRHWPSDKYFILDAIDILRTHGNNPTLD